MLALIFMKQFELSARYIKVLLLLQQRQTRKPSLEAHVTSRETWARLGFKETIRHLERHTRDNLKCGYFRNGRHFHKSLWGCVTWSKKQANKQTNKQPPPENNNNNNNNNKREKIRKEKRKKDIFLRFVDSWGWYSYCQPYPLPLS